MEITITEEPPDSGPAVELIHELDALLANQNYPEESRHAYSVEKLVSEAVRFFIARFRGEVAGCSGLKIFDGEYCEVKRMYVRPNFRGRGLAKAMLDRLSDYALNRDIHLLRLETGIFQAEAIGLYEQCGFERCGPFGDYKNDPMSVYFEKRLARVSV